MRQQPSAKSRYALKIKLLLSIVAVAAVVSCGKPADPAKLAAEKDNSPVVESPLSKAVIQGDLTEITGLLDSGADINARDALGRTPLHMAAFYGRVKTSEVLIDHGAEINAKDRVGMTLAVSGISFPAFALGMLLMQIFSVQLGWLPTVGADSWKHYILPSLTLGAGVAAVMARFTRSSFINILKEDYVRTARAKGLNETVVVAKHAFRNALIPIVTMMGLQFGFLLGGSIVVEVVFNWPGMGRLLVDAVDMRDYPIIQGLVLLFSLEFILINLAVDVLYAVINPTIRFK